MTRTSPQTRLFGAIAVLATGGVRGATPERVQALRTALEAMPPPPLLDGSVDLADVETVMRVAAACALKRGVTPATIDLLRAARGVAADYYRGLRDVAVQPGDAEGDAPWYQRDSMA